MINQQLLDFIKGQLAKGFSKEKITSDLLANGWTVQDIEGGFNSLIPSAVPTPSIPILSNIPTSPSLIKTDQKAKESKLLVFIRILVVSALSLIFSYYTLIFYLNNSGPNAGYLFLGGGYVVIFMFVVFIIPYFFLFRFLLKHVVKYRFIIYTICIIFICVNFLQLFLTYKMNTTNFIIPAKISVADTLKVGDILQYNIDTQPKTYYYDKGQHFYEVNLKKPDGTVVKDQMNLGTIPESCTKYFIVPVCNTTSKQNISFYDPDYNSNYALASINSSTLKEPGTYTLFPDPSFSDSSDLNSVTFTVAPNATYTAQAASAELEAEGIIILSPSGGETWNAGETHDITWTSVSSLKDQSIAIVVEGETTGLGPQFSIPISADKYSWKIPDTVSPGKYGINIFTTILGNTKNTSVYSKSFTIHNSQATTPIISIISPGVEIGENWALGTTHTITWKQDVVACSSGEKCAPRLYDVSLINVRTQETQSLVKGISAYSYDWTIPTSLDIGKYYIQVCQENSVICSSSSGFSIISGSN